MKRMGLTKAISGRLTSRSGELAIISNTNNKKRFSWTKKSDSYTEVVSDELSMTPKNEDEEVKVTR